MAWRQVLWSPGSHGETANLENTAFEKSVILARKLPVDSPIMDVSFHASVLKAIVNVEIMFFLQP